MKCLSVSQPFASLMATGRKTIDLRTWNTRLRGGFLIHAPQKIRATDCKRLGIAPEDLVTGAIIGRATIYDVKTYGSAAEVRRDRMLHHAGTEFDDCRYGFLIKDSVAFRVPIPCKGSLRFFEVELPGSTQSPDKKVLAEIIDEEHRYRLIGHH